MTDDDGSPIFERGDVVFGADPFKGGVAARPWLVVSNHEGRAFHGEQHIALTLTTKTCWTASSRYRRRGGSKAGRQPRVASSLGRTVAPS